MTRVTNILDTKGHDVATISQERTVRDAVEILRERGIGALVVTGASPPLVGILSERDVVRALAGAFAAVFPDLLPGRPAYLAMNFSVSRRA